jgi:opacity protein-like surface antigen
MFIKRNLIFIFIILMTIGFEVSDSRADEDGKTKWGVSVLVGPSASSALDFTHLALLPRAGWALHKKWDFELEGNFSYYSIHREKNIYLLGVNGNFLFKPVQWGKITPFLIAGGGLAYNNNNGNVWEMGDSHTAGILQGGGGILYYMGKGLWLRGEYRYHHISDPFERDYGLNTHSFILGVTF